MKPSFFRIQKIVITSGVLIIAFILAMFSTHHSDSITLEKQTGFYTITATYPDEKWDADGIMRSFVEKTITEKEEAWKVGGPIYNEEQKIAKDFPDRPTMKYEYAVTFKKYASKKMKSVSYAIFMYEFTGGAHGMTSVVTFTFTKSGALSLDSVIDFSNHGNDIALTRVLAQKLRDTLGDMKDETMIREGLGLSYLKADGKTFDKVACHCDGFFFPSNFQNFVIEDTGIRFIMTPYQVAPYAAGMPEIVFTWKELELYTSNMAH